MNALLALINYGQSYWLDNLTRRMIAGGELKRRVTKEGLRGNTSNPAIFNKAISSGNDYDQQIKKLVNEKKTINEIYDGLTVKDVQDACDILRQVYDESKKLDGYISLEVSPYLAHDAEGTMNDARRLYKAVNRPNCFIKIPGTKEGVGAIEQMLYEGININVTLLFSIASYEAVANAYINALERRLQEGKPIDDVTSVASFFLSRIDVLTDQLLGHLIIPEKNSGKDPRPEHLLGKTAVASAKLAYQSFKRIFSGERWQKLADKGAAVQRPLWASTSTKDPLYDDVKYVEPLIGKDTVNTMPEVTISAFADHGQIVEDSIEKGVDEAKKVFDDLKEIGIDIDFVTDQLVNEGIQKFIDPFDNLMNTLAKKRKEILGDKTGFQKISYGKSESQVKEALKSLDEKQYTRRLFAKDAYLWKSDEKSVKAIKNRLGWLNINDFIERTEEIENFAKKIKNEKFKYIVLLGMGGSSLCPEVARETFGSKSGFPQLIMLDNTDPAAVKYVESKVEILKTLFIVASKSGTTTETLSFYKYFYDVVQGKGVNKPGSHFIAITDPGTPLEQEAKSEGFRKAFINPEDYGGRYSALSYFGLVPMALIGIDIKKILGNARQMEISSGAFIPSTANPSISLGTFLGINQKQGRDKVTFILSQSVSAFGFWVEQLIAESTGKEGTGLLPVEGETPGKPEVYGTDRVFTYMYTSNDDNEKNEKKLKALEKAGHPVVKIELQNKLALGAEFIKWELATATAGRILNVNPFDEPNVAESKKNSKDLLNEWKEKGTFGEGEPILQDGEIVIFCNESADWMFEGHRKSIKAFLNKFVKLANSPDYLALLAYFLQTPERTKILQSIRLKLRDKQMVATTLGFGPRYMHSTGQLHKGGPNNGVIILFTYDSEEDLNIPGNDYGFATLQKAQALGDFRSLNDKKRRVIRIHLGKNVEHSLKKLESSLKSA
jgi:transaldolase / glucose-6-phosphate isomerase